MITRTKINASTVQVSYESGASVVVENLLHGEVKYTYPNGVYAIEWYEKEDEKSYYMTTWYSPEGVRLSEDEFSPWGQDNYDLGSEKMIDLAMTR
jgi:hypothetical protein